MVVCAVSRARNLLARMGSFAPSLAAGRLGVRRGSGKAGGGGSMLSVYIPRGTCLERVQLSHGTPVPDNSVWFDLVTPTLTEDKLLERHLGIAVPTREEMQEIEVTSRLYVENGARYMTATLMCQSDTET